MDRREFLRRAALVGGAAYVGSRVPWAVAGGRPSPGLGLPEALLADSILNNPAADSPIDTVVVLMMENRSADHFLGWLATDNAFLATGATFDGDNTQTYVDGRSGSPTFNQPVSTYHLPSVATADENPYRGCGHPDPGHGWTSGRAQRNGGLNDGFLATGSGNDEFALGYYAADDLPLLGTLARRFTTFDGYFCSVLTSTYPNRLYLHSASSGGYTFNYLPIQEGGHQWKAIWDKLQAAGYVPRVDAASFFIDLPPILLFGRRVLPFMAHAEEYFARAASGTLPKVTFLDPGFTTGLRTDDHPFADIRAGQKLVLDYVKAFVESPHWERGVFFITYDEWGGFFDHVPPPIFQDDLLAPRFPGGTVGTAGIPADFGQAGFRVPTLMVSPYAPKGSVDHAVYDHTSILRFIEWRFLGAPATGPGADTDTWFLTKRDRNAANIGAALQSTIVDADVHLPLLPEVPVASAPCHGEELEGLAARPPTGPGGTLEEHAFETAYRAGYFERVGYDVDLRPLPSL